MQRASRLNNKPDRSDLYHSWGVGGLSSEGACSICLYHVRGTAEDFERGLICVDYSIIMLVGIKTDTFPPRSSRKEAERIALGAAEYCTRNFQISSISMRYTVLCLLAAAFLSVSESSASLDTAGESVEYLAGLLKNDKGIYVPTTRFYYFDIRFANKTVNCVTKLLLTVNGEFPGPTIYAVEGDRIVVNVTNHADANMTIHWHGVKQRLSGWEDGTAYITQCPLQQGDYFTYNFSVAGQRGTVFWHAHIGWARASVHGAMFLYPATFSYPFCTPANEFPVIIGEWWNAHVMQVELAGLLSGAAFATAEALVINGKPGPRYNCSASEGISTLKVSPRKSYLLRIINAALNTEVFFGVASHTLTVVEVDSEYVKPFQAPWIFIAPGQTMNVLITTHNLSEGSSFYMAAKSFKSQVGTDYIDFTPAEVKLGELDFPMVAGSGLIQYTTNASAVATMTNRTIPFPRFPRTADTKSVTVFQNKLRTMHPKNVPQVVDRHLFFVVGISSLPCVVPPQNCTYRAAASVNNVTFNLPTIALLQAAYYNISGVFSTDFPDRPLSPFNYTYPLSPPLAKQISQRGTRLSVIEYGEVVQLVLQDTMVFQFENHPFHLHGHSFFVIGRGTGNYNAVTSPSTFNTYDPPLRFTIDVPSRGWVVIRFKTTNPGLWLFHCHLDKHVSWGMEMVFYVKNGVGVNETLPPPPRLTKC